MAEKVVKIMLLVCLSLTTFFYRSVAISNNLLLGSAIPNFESLIAFFGGNITDHNRFSEPDYLQNWRRRVEREKRRNVSTNTFDYDCSYKYDKL